MEIDAHPSCGTARGVTQSKGGVSSITDGIKEGASPLIVEVGNLRVHSGERHGGAMRERETLLMK